MKQCFFKAFILEYLDIMINKKAHILVVDDEEINLEIIELLFEDVYDLTTAMDGKSAWQILEQNPTNFDAILLDRIMPKMNGMEVLKKIKAHPILQYCPVIFQTAKTDTKDIAEGMDAGAYYYISKPFKEEVLFSVVKTAVHDYRCIIEIQRDLEENKVTIGTLTTAHFKFKTLQEARSIALLISSAYPDPASIVMGLTELMINAIEHGNLGITYAEKSLLNAEGTWVDEVEKRQQQQQHKKVCIDYHRDEKEIVITIVDEGIGFDWQHYMDFDPNRVMDNHGRGIAVANKLSFSSVEYQGNGNTVRATLKLPQ